MGALRVLVTQLVQWIICATMSAERVGVAETLLGERAISASQDLPTCQQRLLTVANFAARAGQLALFLWMGPPLSSSWFPTRTPTPVCPATSNAIKGAIHQTTHRRASHVRVCSMAKSACRHVQMYRKFLFHGAPGLDCALTPLVSGISYPNTANMECEPCHPTCRTTGNCRLSGERCGCSGPSADDCDQCVGFTLLQPSNTSGGTTLTQCLDVNATCPPGNYGVNGIFLQCLPCNPACDPTRGCSGPNANQCDACRNTHVWNNNFCQDA